MVTNRLMEKCPRSPFPDQTLDPDIAPLVEALRSDPNCVTLGSCSGHKRTPASIDFAVRGMEGLRATVAALNRVDQAIGEPEGAVLDLALNYNEEVVTSCNFIDFPNWVMLSLTVWGRTGPPSKRLLRRMAKEWRWDSKDGAHDAQ